MGNCKLNFKGLEFVVTWEKIKACLGSDIGEFVVTTFFTSYFRSTYLLLVSNSIANKAIIYLAAFQANRVSVLRESKLSAL